MATFLGVNPSKVQPSTENAEFDLGDVQEVTGHGEFVFGKANGALTKGMFVVCDVRVSGQCELTPYTTGLVVPTVGCQLGVVHADIADNGYGWAMVRGRNVLRVLANCAANVALRATGTAGALDDSGGGSQVHNIQLTAARGGTTGTAPCVLNHPFV